MAQRGSVARRGETWTSYWFTVCPGGIVHRGSETPCRPGHRVQRTRGGFRTKSEARTYLNGRLHALGDGSYSEPADKKMTVSAFLDEHWLPAIRTEALGDGKPRRPATVAQYTVAINKWIKPHLGGERLIGLTPAHVEEWIKTLRERGGHGGQPLGDRAVQVAYTLLRAAVEHALRRGYVERNVVAVVGRPGAKAREMTAWTAEQARTFLAGTVNSRHYAMWALFLARGPRRGELAGLRWEQVDLDAGRMTLGVHTRIMVDGAVAESEAKTRAGRRTISLDAGLVAVLRAHRARQLEERLAWGPAWQETGLVFTREDGAALNPESISQAWERQVARLGLPKIRLHDARHTAASLMLEDGTPVKVAAEMLGHANPSITQATYQHVLPGMAESAGERLSGRLLGGVL